MNTRFPLNVTKTNRKQNKLNSKRKHSDDYDERDDKNLFYVLIIYARALTCERTNKQIFNRICCPTQYEFFLTFDWKCMWVSFFISSFCFRALCFCFSDCCVHWSHGNVRDSTFQTDSFGWCTFAHKTLYRFASEF